MNFRNSMEWVAIMVTNASCTIERLAKAWKCGEAERSQVFRCRDEELPFIVWRVEA